MAIKVKLPRRVSGEELARIFEEEARKIENDASPLPIIVKRESEIRYEYSSGLVKEVIKGQMLRLVKHIHWSWEWFIFSNIQYCGAYHITTFLLVSDEHYDSLQLIIKFERARSRGGFTIEVKPGDARFKEIEPTLLELIAGIYRRLYPLAGG